MKRIIALMMVFVLVLTACGGATNDSTELQAVKEELDVLKGTLKTLQVENANLKQEIADLTTVPSSPETTATSSLIGERKNPAKFSETINFYGTYGGDEASFTMALNGLIRGEEAFAKMKADNKYNEISENEEPIYFIVDFSLLKYAPEDDDYYYLSDMDFNYHNADYSEYNTSSNIVVKNELSTKLYEGSTISEIVGLIIPKDSQGYIVFDDLFWFKLP